MVLQKKANLIKIKTFITDDKIHTRCMLEEGVTVIVELYCRSYRDFNYIRYIHIISTAICRALATSVLRNRVIEQTMPVTNIYIYVYTFPFGR